MNRRSAAAVFACLLLFGCGGGSGPRQIPTTVNRLGKRAVTKTTVKIMSPYHGSALAGVAMGQGDAQFSRLADRF